MQETSRLFMSREIVFCECCISSKHPLRGQLARRKKFKLEVLGGCRWVWGDRNAIESECFVGIM